MSVQSLIDAGELDRYAIDYRRCRDHGYQSNCGDYARRQLEGRHPSEGTQSITGLVTQGDQSRRRGLTNQQNQPGYVSGDYGGYDPADIQRRGGNARDIRYRYVVTVDGTIVGGRRAGTTIGVPVVLTSSVPLSRGDIDAQAAAAGLAILQQYATGTPPDTQASIPTITSTRIESAYRDRE